MESDAEPFQAEDEGVKVSGGRNAIDLVAEGSTMHGIDRSPPRLERHSSLRDVQAGSAGISNHISSSALASSRSPSRNSTATLQSIHLTSELLAIILPPVSQRWEYKTYDADPRVRKVVKEVKDAVQLSYLIQSRDGRTSVVSMLFSTLLDASLCMIDSP